MHGSRASPVAAPAWLARLLTPLMARAAARQLAKTYPGLSPAEIGEKLRADIPSGLGAEQGHAFIAAVLARLPGHLPEQAEPAVPDEKPASAWALIAANLLPLYAVLFWNWEVFPLLVLFWMENVIIGALNAARMLTLDPRDAALWVGKLFMVPFFCFHYGLFTLVHGMFVFAMFGQGAMSQDALPASALRVLEAWNLWLPLGALVASHLFSFFWNYLYRGEFRRAALSELMVQPYKRVMILHLTILIGGFGAMALGSPLWALVVLVAIKVGLDLHAHRKEHRV
jgi:uncharacterized protein DUF6498